jgi:hypothetical protein
MVREGEKDSNDFYAIGGLYQLAGSVGDPSSGLAAVWDNLAR